MEWPKLNYDTYIINFNLKFYFYKYELCQLIIKYIGGRPSHQISKL